MKSFIEFIVEQTSKPTLITAIPSHGTKVWHATVQQHLEPRKLGHNP